MRPDIKCEHLLWQHQKDPLSLYAVVFQQLVNYSALSTKTIPNIGITHFTLLNLEPGEIEDLGKKEFGDTDPEAQRTLVTDITKLQRTISNNLSKSISRIREYLFKRKVSIIIIFFFSLFFYS
jgi:predicted PurR-regulated permease PerM